MRVRNGNALDLEATAGEVIAVTVAPRGTAPLVNFVLNGAPWPGGSFAMARASLPTQLLVLCTFSHDTGGSYDVMLVGAGGSSARYTVAQLRGAPGNAIVFTIAVT